MRNRIPFVKSRPRVAVLRLAGVIAANRRGAMLSDAALATTIERAFRKGRPAAVALALNSPGGAPVQAALIAARLRRLADEKKVPLYAFVEDVAASGGYWLACAADQVWVDPASIVGSIGVISSSFGFHDFLSRHGIERRVHTAGRSKSFLDPFQPEKPEDIARLTALQGDIHETFIDYVKTRRGARLSQEAELFTGDFWTGRRAVELGLADGIGHLVPKMKEIYGPRTRFVTYGARRGLLSRFGLSGQIAAVGSAIDEDAHWARFGL